jgi:abelson tyrosine-protein kinase 1
VSSYLAFQELCVENFLLVASRSTPITVSPGSSDDSYRTAIFGEIWSGSPPSHEPYVPEGHVQTHTAQPVYFTPSLNPSRASSIFTTAHGDSDEGGGVFEHSGYDSPPPANERIAEGRNERRYRMLLSHDFHPSCKLLLLPSLIVVCLIIFLYSNATVVDAFTGIDRCRWVPVET